MNIQNGKLNDLTCDYVGLIIPLCKTSSTTWSQNTKRIQSTVASCPSGWSSYNGHCYFIGNSTVTQYAAQAYCNIQGAFLAEITSQLKFNWVVSFVKSANKTVWVN